MTTEKMRVSASSVISSVAETSATPARCRGRMVRHPRRSVPFALGMTWPIRLFGAAFVGGIGDVGRRCCRWRRSSPSRPHHADTGLRCCRSVPTASAASCVISARNDRSSLGTAQMPVCARCTGIYAGAAIAAIAWPFVGRLTSFRSNGVPSLPAREGGALRAAQAMLLDRCDRPGGRDARLRMDDRRHARELDSRGCRRCRSASSVAWMVVQSRGAGTRAEG